jgi:HD-GYP domain-containing protein (c-di-GMP phosphodiesterase class II)
MNNDKIIKIVQSLVSIRDLDALMENTLMLLRDLVMCDAGSIFIYNSEDDSLVFKYIQNDSIDVSYKEFSIPLDEKSIASYSGLMKEVVHVEDVYYIDTNKPYKFNVDFDKMSGYRTKSVLSIPLLNINKDLIGVLQLINRKVEKVKLTSSNVDDVIIPFSAEDISILYSLSGIVAVALENSILYGDIERMWDGFITASIQAIEARDPVTRGHTDRVTKITMKIAEEMDKDDVSFPDFKMTPDDVTLLRYSCLLHDFGKIGVREYVLNKPKKLFPDKLEAIKYKFLYAMCVAKSTSEDAYNKLVSYYESVLKANEPTVLDSDIGNNLKECANYAFKGINGEEIRLLEDAEYGCLSVKRGTLTEEERKEIESHVYHTYDYLNKIPWTQKLKDVPKIACMHHEKLDGTGYPFGLSKDEIHMFGKIMAVADIFDALTAKDRPYKKAMSVENALEILKEEANNNKLDEKIVDLFIQKRVFEKI